MKTTQAIADWKAKQISTQEMIAISKADKCSICEECGTHNVSGWQENGLYSSVWIENQSMCSDCIHDTMLQTMLTINGERCGFDEKWVPDDHAHCAQDFRMER